LISIAKKEDCLDFCAEEFRILENMLPSAQATQNTEKHTKIFTI